MTSNAERIMNIAKDNTLAAVVLTGMAPEIVLGALDIMEKYHITRDMVNCFWTHECKHDRGLFDHYIISLKARPAGCQMGCIWEPAKVDESEIFGPTEKESFRDCAMANCETPSKYFCSYCYCVRYCSSLCQRLDRTRHRGECKHVVDAVLLLKPRGEIYAKRIVKNNISISDDTWKRLWVKHGAMA